MVKTGLSSLLCVLFWAIPSHATDCTSFNDWLPWTEKCIWLPLAKYYEGLAEACATSINVTRWGPSVILPAQFPIPEKCGHCSFRLRCRKRDRQDGCYSLDLQKETCAEFGDVCTVAKHPNLGCKWNLMMGALKNCANRPDIPDWRRDVILQFVEKLPESNCVEKDGQCKCCCHPYRPSEDCSTCVKEEEKQCSKFGEYNQWSQCLWYPLENVFNGIRDHCQLQAYVKGELPKNLIPKLEGFQIPEKCGYCSFKVRCRKRDRIEGCFSIDGDKKSCGPEDCPTCGNVCTVPKIADGCDWGRVVGSTLMGKVEKFSGVMPYWKSRGIQNLLRHLPYGKCKEINGQCKCCCHPYEPNEDGTACVLSAMCSVQPSH